MVNSLMYCSEQIVVPETFPNILKNFAKAAIRTQPYDLLRWSSAYFRCLAKNEPPPAKCRLEEDVECGAITKGYLRVLLDQVGKGFFISREVLQKKWEGLCLPQDDLLKYLSVCRMMNWPQVHWLKLFAVMVGSLNETPRGTLTMLCELLTEDVEGGPSRIPMWMFRAVYTFVAELDCSQEQHFVNGRKQLADGDLEPETVMDSIPKVFSTSSLKQQIMDECLQRYNEEYQNDENTQVFSLKAENTTESIQTAMSSSTSSTISSGFQIAGKFGDPKQIIQKCGDFDSLILLLREAQGAKLHEYEGPYHISEGNIEHAKRREAKIQELRAKQADTQGENAKKYLHLESINMLREVGPPWSWIHQFVSNNCANVSYNFIEEQSIASDVTPLDSSDESFDFRREKPISSRDSEEDSHIFSTTTDNPEDLIKDEKAALQSGVEKSPDKKPTLQNLANKFATTESKDEVDLTDVSSIVSYINKDEMGVLLRGGERAAPNFSVEILDQILKDAMQNGTVFEDIDEVNIFVKHKYEDFIKDTQTEFFLKSGYYQTLKSGEQLVSDEICAEEISAEESVHSVEQKKSEEESKISDGSSKVEEVAALVTAGSEKSGTTAHDERDEKDSSSADEDMKTAHSAETPGPDVSKIKTAGTLENVAYVVSEQITIGGIGDMENVFDSCGIEADPKLLAKKISDTMILGLVDKEASSELDAEETIQSTLDPTENADSRGGYMSDISGDDITTPSSFQPGSDVQSFVCGVDTALRNAVDKRPDYECFVPPYPGIGKSVSEKTIHDFLTYLKFRSRSQKGMVLPRNFREDKCPKMFD